MSELKGFHIPDYQGAVVKKRVGGTTLLLPDQTPDDVRRAADQVSEAAARLLPQFSTDQLAEIFGRAAAYWQRDSEEKRRLVAGISDLTGLSRPVVERSITVEQGNSSTADILAAMDRELGDHRVLDHFVDDPKLAGRTRAFGPGLVAAVLTANVPGLSYLPMVRALMVKSPLIAKLSSGEPVFGPAWVASVARIAPELAQCIGLFCWQGANPELEEALFTPAGLVILYGGPQTIPRLRERAGPHKKILEHGHKIGIAMVGREKLASETAARELAEKLAYDVAMFDQRACIAPQLAYVESGSAVSSQRFAELLGEALAELEATLPPSPLSLDTAATLAQERNLAAFMAAGASGQQLVARGSATVLHAAEAGFEGVLPTRFLRIYPVGDLATAFDLLRPHGSYLQNVGLAVGPARMQPLAEELARAGVSHITGIGMMHRPTMRWHHDGLAAFGEMVRWCDIELMEQG